MNGRNAPLSPVSVGSNEWSGYPSMDNDGPYPKSRGQLVSPPNSGISVGAMNAAFPSGPRSAGGPSPPPSIGRSSTATNLYARSESGRSTREEINESVLGEHYVALKRFLSQTSRDGKPNSQPNKARDKLQRLTSVQFLELSTDVFDELMRRQAFARRPPNAPPSVGPPPYLTPEETFHPKRNQARQKLSSLGPPRFRDLATDVFVELERRFPRFSAGDIPRLGSPASSIRAPSRTGTPVNGNGMNGYPPRGPSRMRRPSESGSVMSMRSAGPMANGYSVPPSPGLPPNNYDRPQPKQFQSNTIVPNKSTMVEEDDDSDEPVSDKNADSYGLGSSPGRRGSKRSEPPRPAERSEDDKRMIEDYEAQVREMRAKLDDMEEAVKKKDSELGTLMDGERSRATAANAEKQELADFRRDLEDRLADAHNLNDSLQQELDRVRDGHSAETRDLREQMEQLRVAAANSANASANANKGPSNANADLEMENQELRMALREQQAVTEEVRREAQDFLREMRLLSEQTGSAWEKQSELERTIESLEAEVRDWRNRYARTKTQLRNMRASSMGLTIDQDAGKYIREKGFTTDNGMVKDVHVTKFQIAIDELLRRARTEEPEKAIDSMKAVVVSVRRITKDMDESPASNDEVAQMQGKLKTRVSSTANNLITAAKNFAMSAGISPVSLLDAAASHLVSAVVELLRTAKIRSTPTGELEDDDDGTITPVDSTGFFSPRSNGQTTSTTLSTQESLPPPPPFQGLGPKRGSVGSSAYSPISSPRESVDRYPAKRPMSRGSGLANGNGMGYMGVSKGLAPAPNGYGMRPQDNKIEDLKIYLDDQTASLVQTIQNLVGSIRSDAAIDEITGQINDIANIVGKVVLETNASGKGGQSLERLETCRSRLLEAGDRGEDLAADGLGPNDREWRMWTQTLPPIAFEIARETKELVQRIDRLVVANGDEDDFS